MTLYKSTLVSVIMPAFNAAAFIAESIDSVLAQTYSDWELLVIDDGSTDATAAIVSAKVAEDRRIIYLYQENGRQAKARNLGLMHAKGRLIAFLDADDLWLADKLEIMVDEFISGSQDLLFSDSYEFEGRFSFDGEGGNAKRMGIVAREYAGFDGLSEFLEINRIPMSTVICRSDIVVTEQFDEMMTPAEDYDLWLRMLIRGCRFRALSAPLAAYRLHSASSTSGDRLVTDTVIAIIYKLSLSVRDDRMKRLMEKKLRGWLRRKLRMVGGFRQFKEFNRLLRGTNQTFNFWIVDVLDRLGNIVLNCRKKFL